MEQQGLRINFKSKTIPEHFSIGTALPNGVPHPKAFRHLPEKPLILFRRKKFHQGGVGGRKKDIGERAAVGTDNPLGMGKSCDLLRPGQLPRTQLHETD
jgi:hypothetical protein